MNTLKTWLIKHKIKLLIVIPILAFALGVCFVQIPDRTRIPRKEIEYIIIHYTANLNPKANAKMNAIYLRNKRKAGTHYCIDDVEVVQCTPENMVAYAVGDKQWKGFTPKPWLLSESGRRKVLNRNSLSFEMCLGGGRNDSIIIEKTAQFVGWQLVNKGLDISRVIRHHDVTGKHCPKFSYNENWNQIKEDSMFNEFRKKVEFYQKIHLDIKRQRKIKQANL